MKWRWRHRGGCALGGGCGCLLFLGISALVISIFALVLNIVKDSEPYQSALTQARNNEQVIQALGEPIEPGWWITGSSETSGTSGFADFAFPLSGPKNSGKLYVVAVKSAGRWEFQHIELEVDGQSARIPLLTGR
jgi:hypothetical protein